MTDLDGVGLDREQPLGAPVDDRHALGQLGLAHPAGLLDDLRQLERDARRVEGAGVELELLGHLGAVARRLDERESMRCARGSTSSSAASSSALPWTIAKTPWKSCETVRASEATLSSRRVCAAASSARLRAVASPMRRQ